MDVHKEVRKVFSELQNGHGSSLYGALIMLRSTLIKSRPAMQQLIEGGFIKLLLQLLEDRARHVNKVKTADIIMSTLANVCIEESVRDKVVACDGIAVIVRVAKASEEASIHNRAIRALANLAQERANCEAILDLEVPSFVANQLMVVQDVECQSTYCRALRLLGQTKDDVKRLVEESQAVQAVAGLIKGDNKKIVLKSLRMLAEFSALRCCPGFTGQILAANVLEELVHLSEDKEDQENQDTSRLSLSLLLRLCEHEIIRPALGSAGFIALMVKLLHKAEDGGSQGVNVVAVLNALCLCSKEAVNRVKIRDTEGLEVMLSALRGGEGEGESLAEGRFAVLYDRIISSLVNFLYNDDCLLHLQELGLVRVLLSHLKRCCQFEAQEDDFRKQTADLAMALVRDLESECKTLSGVTMTNEVEGEICGAEELLVHGKNSSAADELHEDAVNAEIGCDDSRSVSENCVEGEVAKEITRSETTDVSDLVNEDKLSSDENVANNVEQPMREFEEVPVGSLSRNDRDPLLIDSDRAVDDGAEVAVETVDSDHHDHGQPGPGPSRHVFSINSPSYQSETSWRLEDYTQGVTCKNFASDHSAVGQQPFLQPSSSHPAQEGAGYPSPYSPLSANVSYYSPSQSSPSYAQSSPSRSSPSYAQSSPSRSFTSSPARSTVDQFSPDWTISSPGHQAAVFSPFREFVSQSPNSPGDAGYSTIQISLEGNPVPVRSSISSIDRECREPPSPVFNSQMSLMSQSSVVDSVTFPNSPHQTAVFEDQMAQELMSTQHGAGPSRAQFVIVPLSQESELSAQNPVYSASEDDDEDEDDTKVNENADGTKKTQQVFSLNEGPSVEAMSSSSFCQSPKNTAFSSDEMSRIPPSLKEGEKASEAWYSVPVAGASSFEVTCETSEDVSRIGCGEKCRDSDTLHNLNDSKIGSETNSPKPFIEVYLGETSPKRRRLEESVISNVVGGSGELQDVARNNRQPSLGFNPLRTDVLTGGDDDTQEQMEVMMSVSETPPSGQPAKADSSQELKNHPQSRVLELSRSLSFETSQVASTSSGVQFHRMSSYPGKLKRPVSSKSGASTKQLGVRSAMSSLASTSPFSRHGSSSPFYSNSPYRSPMPEPFSSPHPNEPELDPLRVKTSESPTVSSEAFTETGEQGKVRAGDVEAVDQATVSGRSEVSAVKRVSEESVNGAAASDKKDSRNPVVAGSSSSRAESRSSAVQTSDARTRSMVQVSERVQKILRITESNILILLSRLSVKTYPIALVEPDVFCCLLSYLRFAPNPMPRCVRILHRLLGHPLCFHSFLLMQAPGLVFKYLVLERDGLLPRSFFSREPGDNRSLRQRVGLHFLGLDTHEVSGSQASDFGKKMDFEFGGDAYSKIMSPSSAGSLFRGRPSLSEDSQSARDGSADTTEPVGEASRALNCHSNALKFVHYLCNTAVSKYGEGEIKHVLTMGSVQDQLSCIISLLYLPVAGIDGMREVLLKKYPLFDTALACLFMATAPTTREAIVVALTLLVGMEEPSKLLSGRPQLHACPDTEDVLGDATSQQQQHQERQTLPKNLRDPFVFFKESSRTRNNSSLVLLAKVKTLRELCCGQARPRSKVTQRSKGNRSEAVEGASLCVYQTLSDDFDTRLVVENGATLYFYANRQVLVRKSAVFAAMLSGMYKESHKSDIVISDVNLFGFEFVIHYLHGCSSGCPVIDSLLPKGLTSSTEQVGHSRTARQSANISQPKQAQQSANISQPNRSELNVLPSSSSGIDSQTEETPSSAHDIPCFSGTASASEMSTISSPCAVISSSSRKQLQDFSAKLAVSEDSLDSLSLGDKNDVTPPDSIAMDTQGSRDNGQGIDEGGATETGTTDNATLSTEAAELKELEDRVDMCADLLAVADRFLLDDLMDYVGWVLSYSCLHPHTCFAVFQLACFYKLELVAVDCARESFTSDIQPWEVASMYEELAACGYRDAARTALARLLLSCEV
ncbi:uncharacterized protein LOC101846199 isoform X2 [Aplysia californica]|uniref:Uncharacterized protein LOC101846199 isoform X2 n=1 Tax=Aplysia californica TaxID=6500 RepID=A0ABM1VPV1_APLCA|nr:uncharacterized protein LOC101846199 isoform X2 [Aplysia californica]